MSYNQYGAMPQQGQGDVIVDYEFALKELIRNEQNRITVLSEIAKGHPQLASSFVAVIEKHINTCPKHCKLLAIYLIDCITNTAPDIYISHFRRNIYEIFTQAYKVVDDKAKQNMRKLLHIWIDSQRFDAPLLERLRQKITIPEGVHGNPQERMLYAQQHQGTYNSNIPQAANSMNMNNRISYQQTMPTMVQTGRPAAQLQMSWGPTPVPNQIRPQGYVTTGVHNMPMQAQNMSMQPQIVPMQSHMMSMQPQNMSLQPQNVPTQPQNVEGRNVPLNFQYSNNLAQNGHANALYGGAPPSPSSRQAQETNLSAKQVEELYYHLKKNGVFDRFQGKAERDNSQRESKQKYPTPSQSLLSKEEDAADSSPVLGFNKKYLEERHDNVIDKLYFEQTNQCLQTGKRFRESNDLRKHLDLLYQRKKLSREQTLSRKWYLTIEQWTKGINSAINVAGHSLEDVDKSQASTSSAAVEVSYVVPADPTVNKCPLSGEKLEAFWNDDQEQWYFRDAIKLKLSYQNLSAGTIVSVQSVPRKLLPSLASKLDDTEQRKRQRVS